MYLSPVTDVYSQNILSRPVNITQYYFISGQQYIFILKKIMKYDLCNGMF